jgi:dUTP pyrophosphatase
MSLVQKLIIEIKRLTPPLQAGAFVDNHYCGMNMPNNAGKLIVKCKKMTETAILPTYATEGSGCFDLYLETPERISLGWFEWSKDRDKQQACVVGTGLQFEIPEGYVMLIFGRSGNAFNSDVRLANCVGVIDHDYRGEVKVKLVRENWHDEAYFDLKQGDRIAQGIIIPYPKILFEEVTSLSQTLRGDGGFGHTGS